MQTEYKTNLDQLILGQTTPHGVNEQITLMADADTVFGSLIKRDTTNPEIGVISDNVADVIVGIVQHEHNDKGLMEEGKALGVKTKGNIAVLTDDNAGIKAGEKAYYTVATKLYSSVSTDAIEVGVFQSSVKNDSLAIVKIDIIA